MAMQNVLDRLAKISKQQTKLSRTRKMDLSLKDDLDKRGQELQAAYDKANSYDLGDAIDSIQSAIENLKQAMGSYRQMETALQNYGDAWVDFEAAMDELGLPASDFENESVESDVTYLFEDANGYMNQLESAASELQRVSDMWPYALS